MQIRKGRLVNDMNKVKVYITNKQAIIKVPVGIRLLIRKCCIAVLKHENFKDNAEISISFVDNQEIHRLNLEFREMDKPTDVLSFPLGENDEYDLNMETDCYMLGDIVISIETALKQSKIYGHSLEREIGFLTVHSMLHLLGYDHETSKLDALKMREKEEAVLESLGVSRNISYIVAE